MTYRCEKESLIQECRSREQAPLMLKPSCSFSNSRHQCCTRTAGDYVAVNNWIHGMISNIERPTSVQLGVTLRKSFTESCGQQLLNSQEPPEPRASVAGTRLTSAGTQPESPDTQPSFVSFPRDNNKIHHQASKGENSLDAGRCHLRLSANPMESASTGRHSQHNYGGVDCT